ncbi:hypothetical protein DC522_06960 [Microvirga sp. KLBC 81]|uniref:hypothetical protein n=1 Tax=Microvirga sp. KLBC 81 TaxID=1862707 RepID=UPI000D50EAC3|nr:hypothetical protein [Microvirga sp. KLBC 81]PVE25260.1 hypothetical protein DC522_06960 [Microvirga sp. KLBC 81]
MNDEEPKLDNRDMYLLGVLAERATELVVKESKFPRGCGEARTLALSRAGYLIGVPYRFADGTAEVRYEITLKGQAAWKAYRFT